MEQPTLAWNLAGDARALFAYPFMVNALEAGTIVAVLAGAVGWHLVLRRQSFAAHTVAVMSFPGAAGAALVGLPVALGYYLACALAALVIGAMRTGESDTRQRESAAIAVVQVAGLALGFLFLSLYGGVLERLEGLLFGTFLGIDRVQVLTLLLVALAAIAALSVIGRPLLLATLDPHLARAQGLPVRLLDVGFMALLALAVAATAQITGVLLVFALLVAPPAAAQALTARPLLGLLLSVVLAALVVWVSLALAYFSVYPLGFYVATIAFAFYLFARLGSLAVRQRPGRTVDVGT
jgi:zinc/manganese transport system permease protein